MPTPRQRASVMIFAVLLLAAGVFVLAGIAQLAATQAVIGQNEWEALGRRVRLENSRSMARQYVLQHIFRGFITQVSFTNSLYGGFEILTENSTDFWTTLSETNVQVNPFTLMERGGFYRTRVEGKLSDGTTDVPWRFQVRTRSPITAGYPVVQQRPASNDITTLVGPPFIDMNNPEQFVGFHEMARMRVSSVTNTNANDTNGYVGYLDVPIGVVSPFPYDGGNLVAVNTNVTELQVAINLASGEIPYGATAYSLQYLLDVDSANFATNGTNYGNVPITSLRLIGTDTGSIADPLAPLQIIIPAERTNLRTIFLEGRNPRYTGRPVYVNYQRSLGSGTPLNVVATNEASGEWRIGISASHSDVSFATAGVVIVGGVRTDGVISNNPTIVRDRDPGALDYIADRMMWLEDYKTP